MAAAATSGMGAARALPALILGSSLFAQLHLVLGYVFRPVAREAIHRAAGPATAVLVAVALAGVIVWLRRRGKAAGSQAAAEACCPACLPLGAAVPRLLRLEGLEPPRV